MILQEPLNYDWNINNPSHCFIVSCNITANTDIHQTPERPGSAREDPAEPERVSEFSREYDTS